jgi:hypothetical protein
VGLEGQGPRLLVAHDDGLMRMWAHPRYIDTPPAPPPSPFAPPPAAPSASCVGWSLCATFPLGPKGPILRVSYHANGARLVYVEEVAGEGGREAPPERLRVVSRDVTLSTPTGQTTPKTHHTDRSNPTGATQGVAVMGLLDIDKASMVCSC